MDKNTVKETKPFQIGKPVFIFMIVLILCSLGANVVLAASRAGDGRRILEPAEPGETTTVQISPTTTLTVAKISETLNKASDLVSSKYQYTNADIYEKDKKVFDLKVPFTTDKSVYTYSGTVLAGINLSEVKIDINDSDKKIKLTLPKVKIISHEIDEKSFQIFDVKNSVFTSTSLQEYADLRDTMKTKEEESLTERGFLNEAADHAKATIRELLEASGLTEGYSIEFSNF